MSTTDKDDEFCEICLWITTTRRQILTETFAYTTKITYFEFSSAPVWKQPRHKREVSSYTTQQTIEFLCL